MDTPSAKIQTKGPNSPLSANTSLPHITNNLLIYLREIHKDTVPTVGMTDREIWIEVGKISVVRHLEDLYRQQNEME